MTLAEEIDARLRAAGISSDDPGLAAIRSWNAIAAESQIVRIELRRGQFGSYRLARLDEVTR